ncbi:hypothetical protein [Thalassospira sp. TSL5-1]|uniref:hypothetical protein n=1 Tax=Thalassospira sp. TSL5-1 TaxID=1544451 RepID=UPI00093D5016|nr:hypothetical protein [Thalassospira sp. TSL5-1]OKH88558.1 hypothetical protein LF95_00075 [Thalassospira sp. TSL5-1]
MLALCDGFTGYNDVTTALVVGLVNRAISCLSRCFTYLSVRVLIFLIKPVYDVRAWRSGRLMAWPGN